MKMKIKFGVKKDGIENIIDYRESWTSDILLAARRTELRAFNCVICVIVKERCSGALQLPL